MSKRSVHWKLYFSSLLGTILFYTFILLLCYHFPFLIVFSVLTFFWFFYRSDLKTFFSSWRSKIFCLGCLPLLLLPLNAEPNETILLLAHPRYSIRESAYRQLLQKGKSDPEAMIKLLKPWTKHTDPEIRWRVRKLTKTLQCRQSEKGNPPLALRILEGTRQGKLEVAEKLCRTFFKNYGEDEDNLAFLHEQIAGICYINLSHKSDLESRYWDIGEQAIRYHHLYLYFLDRGEKISLLANQALGYYEERIQAGPMQRYDDHFKKIILYYSCLKFILGEVAQSQTIYEEYTRIEGNITPFDLAFYYATLQDSEKAFEYLLQALETQGYEAWVKFRNSYYFDSLQSDPRYSLIYDRKGDQAWDAYRRAHSKKTPEKNK